MAYSASTGFRLRQGLYSNVEPSAAQVYLIDDSATIKVGDALTMDSDGNVRRSAVGEPVFGVCVGITDRNGINLFTSRSTGKDGATLTQDDQVAASSTNTSDATRNLKARVLLDPAGAMLYYNDASGSLARTNLLNFFDVASGASQIDQGSASESNGQFQLIAIDPDGDGDASKGLFRIAEGQLGGIIDSGTDKIPA